MLLLHTEENLNWNILNFCTFEVRDPNYFSKLNTDLNPTQIVMEETWATLGSFIQDRNIPWTVQLDK